MLKLLDLKSTDTTSLGRAVVMIVPSILGLDGYVCELSRRKIDRRDVDCVERTAQLLRFAATKGVRTVGASKRGAIYKRRIRVTSLRLRGASPVWGVPTQDLGGGRDCL